MHHVQKLWKIMQLNTTAKRTYQAVHDVPVVYNQWFKHEASNDSLNLAGNIGGNNSYSLLTYEL